MALAAGGSFRTLAPSLHCKTQLTLLDSFIGTKVRTTRESDDAWLIEVPEPGRAASDQRAHSLQ
jgi:RNA 3'-terminal phosphate cyclase